MDNHEGAITLRTWNRNAVKYEAAVRPEDDADHPEATVVKVDSAADRFEARTEYDESKGDDGGFWGGGQAEHHASPLHPDGAPHGDGRDRRP